MNDWTVAPTLDGQHVRLEPLRPEHLGGLCDAVADGELWNLGFAGVPRVEAMAAYIASAVDQQRAGNQLPVVVRDRLDVIVGTTRFYAIDRSVPRVLLGYTWYAQRVQRTGLNTEAKLLLLGHAFENLRCISVGFETSTRNTASRAAISRLGAQQDGILRSHRRHADGSVRDTVAFSIIDAEWPAAKRDLQAKLARNGARHD